MSEDKIQPAHNQRGPTKIQNDSPATLILVGRFGAAHGVRGEIRIKSFTAEPLAIAHYGDLLNRAGDRRFRLTNVRHVKDDMLVARILGVENRDSAEIFVNQELFVNRSQLPVTGEDEFYLADLIGLEARLASGKYYGRVSNIANFGGGDILEIDTGGSESRLVPFTKAAVPEIKIADGYVVVLPPLEIDGEEDMERSRNK